MTTASPPSIGLEPVPLGELASFVRGVTFDPSQRTSLPADGRIACFRTSNIQDELAVDDVIFVPPEVVGRDEQMVREGDILISSANSWELVGKAVWIPKLDYPATVGGFTSLLRADRKRVDPRYLYFWFRSPLTQQKVRECSRKTTNISNLSFPLCAKLLIPIPFPDDPRRSLAEQKRIAAILDKADAIRRRRQEAARLADTLIPSVFFRQFGDTLTNSKKWTVKPLAQVVADGTDVTYGIVQCGPHVENGIPYFRTSDISNNKVPPLREFGRTSPEIADRFARSRVRAGDLVYAIRATIGAVVSVPAELDGANLTQGTARIAPGHDVTPNYLLWALRSQGLQTWVNAQCKGATFKEITLSRLREMPVPVPPKTLQNEFHEFALRVEKAIAERQHLIAAVDDLLNSLVQRAFRGELCQQRTEEYTRA